MENYNYQTPPATPERPTKSGRARSGYLVENYGGRSGSSQRRLNMDGNFQFGPNALAQINKFESPSTSRAPVQSESPERIEKLYRALALENGSKVPGSHQKLTFPELEDHAEESYDIVSHIQAFENILMLFDKMDNKYQNF